MPGKGLFVGEQQDVPTIYADGSVRIEVGDMVRILYTMCRASEPGVRDHVATVVMPRAAFLRCLAAAHLEMPGAMQLIAGLPN